LFGKVKPYHFRPDLMAGVAGLEPVWAVFQNHAKTLSNTVILGPNSIISKHAQT
jgi:hypothetical protein